MSFGPVDPRLDLPAVEDRVLARWRAHDVVARAQAHRDGAEPWVFYEGPPTANGRPGLHHVWARVFKDIYPRFQTMRGRSVPRKGGWDCHGLPVELEVEKELGLSAKHEIEAYGIERFNDRCRESVQRYVEDWSALTTRSGTWIDTADAYWTLSNEYIESVWWLVRRLWDRGLLYEGHRVSPYCARCGTALSSHEVAQGYEDVIDPSIYLRFPVVDHDVDLLVWTTTPWTLVSNVATAVGPDITYVRIAPGDGRDLVLSAGAADRLYPDTTPSQTWSGRDLVGWRYDRPFDVLPLDENAARVVAADFVSTEDGAGIVHLAPAFGEDDATVGRAEGLPTLNPVDADGAFDDTVPAHTGRFVKDADRPIIEDLDRRGLLVAEAPYEHSYPHCWRCSTPLIYWAKTSWFARTADRRPDLVRENERIGWHPEHLKHGRFGKWLEANIDWALSRDRYWGTPLPIWRCTDCGHDRCFGSVTDLADASGRDLSSLDLHRPFVDDVTVPCTECGGTARRLEPVIDAWFDSGAMPSAQHHHPFTGEAAFAAAFPADFICEAIDQTRGWFYSLLAVNTLAFDSTPYLNVVCLGHIVDEDGQKMSKSRGNVIDPWEIFGRHGADALRWYFFSAGQPWTSRRVFEDAIRESSRQTLVTLWNVFSFFATYADLDGWTPGDGGRPEPAHVLDRWVLAELDDAVRTVTTALDEFDALGGATRLASFVDDLSNWYVRRSRGRFWKHAGGDGTAHAVLHHCLVVTSRLLGPFCPFLADEIHHALTGRDDERSVHLADWPVHQEPDEALRVEMAAARRLVGLGRAARDSAEVRTRQPLRRAIVLHDADFAAEVEDEIRAELNVHALERIDTLGGLITWTVTPNFRALGPRLGPRVNDVKAALAAADGNEIHRILADDGAVDIAGERLVADELELRAESHDQFALTEDGGWAVALDLSLDEDLVREGTARELIRAVNDLRRAEGFEIADRIRLRVRGDEHVADVLDHHRDHIAGEVLAVKIDDGDGDHELDVAGHQVLVDIERVTPA